MNSTHLFTVQERLLPPWILSAWAGPSEEETQKQNRNVTLERASSPSSLLGIQEDIRPDSIILTNLQKESWLWEAVSMLT